MELLKTEQRYPEKKRTDGSEGGEIVKTGRKLGYKWSRGKVESEGVWRAKSG